MNGTKWMRSGLVLALGIWGLAACGSPATPSAGEASPAPPSGDSVAPAVEAAAPTEAADNTAEPMGADVQSPFSVVPDMDRSKLTFVSTKNAGVEVAGSFGVVLGGFDLAPGDLAATSGVLNVELDSVDTGLAPRDTNIAETFFGHLPGKVVRSDVEFLRFEPKDKTLAVGAKTTAGVDLRINLRGHGNLATAQVELERTGENAWVLRTLAPVVLSISDLGMGGRADSLKQRCGHQSIGDEVRISAEVVLLPPR